MQKNEEAQLVALRNALLRRSVDPKEVEWGTAPKWGNIVYMEEQAKRAKETPAEKAKREAAEAAKNLERRKAANIQKKKAAFMTMKGLRKIAKACKWECQGEKCWAHEAKTCPFIHKGEPGWNEKSAVPKSSSAAAGSGSGKKGRRSTRRTNATRRRQRK